MAQYQSSALRVLTYFVADATEAGPGQHNFLLGSDWQVEVTQMVKDSLRVLHPHVAQVLQGHVLLGRSAGTTTIQVQVYVCVCVYQHRWNSSNTFMLLVVLNGFVGF